METNTMTTRHIVIDPTVSAVPFGPFNSERDARDFIADRQLPAAGISPESTMDPSLRTERSLVRDEDGTWVRS